MYFCSRNEWRHGDANIFKLPCAIFPSDSDFPPAGLLKKESQRSSEAMIASPREDHGGATTLPAVIIIGQKRILEERENILFRKHDYGCK